MSSKKIKKQEKNSGAMLVKQACMQDACKASNAQSASYRSNLEHKEFRTQG
jgi:hypothetical protein